jgi:hypothetical protein
MNSSVGARLTPFWKLEPVEEFVVGISKDMVKTEWRIKGGAERHSQLRLACRD